MTDDKVTLTITPREVQDIITDELSGLDFGDTLPSNFAEFIRVHRDPDDPSRINCEMPIPIVIDPVEMFKRAWLEACAELRERCEAMDAVIADLTCSWCGDMKDCHYCSSCDNDE